jgi:hypothetical protein
MDLNEQTLLILVLLYYNLDFKLEYKIKDFVFTNAWLIGPL